VSTDILTLADRLWRGEAQTSEFHPVSHLGGLAEICDGVRAPERELAAGGRVEPGQAARSACDVGVADLPGGEKGLRVAGHLAELAWLAAPEDNEIAQARQRVYSIRAERATSTMSAGRYRWAAGRSLGDPFGQLHRSGRE
jgi:hypothetical protein